MKLSVVIPSYNHYNLTHQLLWDLYKSCHADIDEVVVIDDSSTDSAVENGLRWWFTQKMLPLQVVWKSKNDGFLKTANLGMKKASGDVLLLVSTDVRINKNICAEIKGKLKENSKKIIGGRLLGHDTGWNQFNGVVYPYLEGWLLACTKNAWEEIGGFDEQYGSSDFEDVDFSTVALRLGYTLDVLSDGARHDHPASTYGYNPEREARTKENREKFREKWTE